MISLWRKSVDEKHLAFKLNARILNCLWLMRNCGRSPRTTFNFPFVSASASKTWLFGVKREKSSLLNHKGLFINKLALLRTNPFHSLPFVSCFSLKVIHWISFWVSIDSKNWVSLFKGTFYLAIYLQGLLEPFFRDESLFGRILRWFFKTFYLTRCRERYND